MVSLLSLLTIPKILMSLKCKTNFTGDMGDLWSNFSPFLLFKASLIHFLIYSVSYLRMKRSKTLQQLEISTFCKLFVFTFICLTQGFFVSSRTWLFGTSASGSLYSDVDIWYRLPLYTMDVQYMVVVCPLTSKSASNICKTKHEHSRTAPTFHDHIWLKKHKWTIYFMYIKSQFIRFIKILHYLILSSAEMHIIS